MRGAMAGDAEQPQIPERVLTAHCDRDEVMNVRTGDAPARTA